MATISLSGRQFRSKPQQQQPQPQQPLENTKNKSNTKVKTTIASKIMASLTKAPTQTQTNDNNKSSSASASAVSPSIDAVATQLVIDLTTQIAEKNLAISPETIMQLLRMTMEAVEGTPIKGEEQKQLALRVLMELVKAADLPEEHMTLIKSLLDGGLMSNTIDLIVEATKGNLDVNKATEVAKGCFARCFGVFCRSKKTNKNKKQNKSKTQANAPSQPQRTTITPTPPSTPITSTTPEPNQPTPETAPEPNQV